jgi:hypothetical protein
MHIYSVTHFKVDFTIITNLFISVLSLSLSSSSPTITHIFISSTYADHQYGGEGTRRRGNKVEGRGRNRNSNKNNRREGGRKDENTLDVMSGKMTEGKRISHLGDQHWGVAGEEVTVKEKERSGRRHGRRGMDEREYVGCDEWKDDERKTCHSSWQVNFGVV